MEVEVDKIKRYQNATMLSSRMHSLQSYDKFPYDKHTMDVEDILVEFGYDRHGDEVIAGKLHDVIEDCPISYAALKKQFGEKIARIIFCVTDEISDGRGNPLENRKQRKKYTLPKTKSNSDAILIKVADRIANVRHSFVNSEKMFIMYQNEYSEFRKELYIEENMDIRLKKMWEHLDLCMEQTVIDE